MGVCEPLGVNAIASLAVSRATRPVHIHSASPTPSRYLPMKPTGQPPSRPTADDIKHLIEFCSFLHHGYYARPPVGSHQRPLWEHNYTTMALEFSKFVAKHPFESIPAIGIACLYQVNRVIAKLIPKVDLEAIHPTADEKPNLAVPGGLTVLHFKIMKNTELHPIGPKYTDFWKRPSRSLLLHHLDTT